MRLAKDKEHLANPLQPPTWAQSFRLGAYETRDLKLPSAYDDFKSALSPDLRDRLDDIYDGSVETKGQGIVRRIKVIIQLVMTAPEVILSIDGVDQEMLDELSRVLREKGH